MSDPAINPCQCGHKKPRLQNFGDLVFVKCGTCGQSRRGPTQAEAVSEWNRTNPFQPPDPDRPRIVEGTGEDLLAWGKRCRAGECHIHTLEVVGVSGYRMHIGWPEPTLTKGQKCPN